MQLVGNFDFFMPYFCPGIFWGNGVFVGVLWFGFTLFFTLCQEGYMIFGKSVTSRRDAETQREILSFYTFASQVIISKLFCIIC